MKNRASGLTLIEILIALIVLVTGLVGILAVFPAAIRSTNESVEDRMASLVADSVVHALVVALRSVKESNVTLNHDGLPNGTYSFSLPASQTFVKHSNGGQPFRLGSDTDYLKQVFEDVIKGPDKTDPYTQYGFTFEVGQVRSIPLYEFRISIYRNSRLLKVFVIQLSGS